MSQLSETKKQLKLAEAKLTALQVRTSEASAESGKSASMLEDTIADLKRQLQMESQANADLRKAKASLESIIANSGKSTQALAASEEEKRGLQQELQRVQSELKASGSGSGTLLEDLKNQLDKKKAEVADLNAKKNKYKKHAKAADARNKELKKRLESAGGGSGSTSLDRGSAETEVEELRAAKARLEKKLQEAKKDYDDLEKEVLQLEEENSLLEEELGRKKKSTAGGGAREPPN